jgi:hypothetical protein
VATAAAVVMVGAVAMDGLAIDGSGFVKIVIGPDA